MTDIVVSGGQTSSGVVLNFGDTLTVLSGGTASATSINNDGLEMVSAGGRDISATIRGGPQGGSVEISSGGIAIGDVVDSGGEVLVEEGGIATTTVVNTSGILFVVSGATASNTALRGGSEFVFGSDTGAIVFSGGVQNVSGTGITLGAIVSSGGAEVVGAFGVASGTVVRSGGELLNAGGNTVGVILSAGGAEIGGGSSTTILSGAVEEVVGADFGATIASGGKQTISGFAVAAVVESGGLQVIQLFGTANEATLSGGNQVVSFGGVASGTLVLAGGRETVLSNGQTQSTNIFSGGVEILSSGGFSTSTTIQSGGLVIVTSLGNAMSTSILGGSQVVSSAGFAENTIVFDGGTEIVASAGTTFSPLVMGPGSLLALQSGAIARGEIGFFLPGGGLEVDSASSVNFVVSGLSPTISGFAPDDTIDLANVPFDSAGSAVLGSGNLLQITESGSAINLQLDPSQDFAGHSFVLAPDAGSGTTVSEPTGGRFLFGPPSGLSGVSLGINNAINPIVGSPVSGNLNIEVFTSKTIDSTLPGLDAGYQQGIIDNGGYIASNPAGYLTGAALQLFGGDYLVVDAAAGGNTPAEILLGSGSQTVAGAAGDTLAGGSGPATMYGGAGNSIAFGSVGQYADGTAGDMTIAVGTGGADLVVGSTVAGSGDTIIGGAAALDYNVGSGGDLLNLAGLTGKATINAFLTGGNDTVVAGNGSTSVWGGGGDRIGVGDGPTVGGTDLWGHSTTVPGAAIGFGSNDALVATNYDTVGGSFSVNSTLPGASSALVTVGGGAGNFDPAHDFLFYPNESSATDAAIVATAQAADGGASSLIALPDGTVMMLTGVTPAQLQTALAGGALFQP